MADKQTHDSELTLEQAKDQLTEIGKNVEF